MNFILLIFLSLDFERDLAFRFTFLIFFFFSSPDDSDDDDEESELELSEELSSEAELERIMDVSIIFRFDYTLSSYLMPNASVFIHDTEYYLLKKIYNISYHKLFSIRCPSCTFVLKRLAFPPIFHQVN